MTDLYRIGSDQDGGVHHDVKWGVYRGYTGDFAASGDNHTATVALEARIGSNVEILMCAGALDGTSYGRNFTPLAGCPQLVLMHYPLVPTGGSLHLAATGSYDSLWAAFAAAALAAGRGGPSGPCNLIVGPGWEAGGSRNSDGSSHGFPWAYPYIDPNTGQFNDPSDFQSAFQRFVTVTRGAGLTGAKFDFNAVSVGGVDWRNLYPGDAYVDIIGWDCYNAISRADLYPRTNQQGVIDGEQTPMWNQVFAFARAHGKLVGCGEYGMILPPAGVTSGNTYTFHTADNAIYFPWIHGLAKANADIFAYLCLFNQNQKNSAGTATTEEDQDWFCGTNPTTQSSSYYHSTNTTGPWYDTPAAARNICHATLMAEMPLAGSMSLAPSVVVPASALPFASTTHTPRLSYSDFG